MRAWNVHRSAPESPSYSANRQYPCCHNQEVHLHLCAFPGLRMFERERLDALQFVRPNPKLLTSRFVRIDGDRDDGLSTLSNRAPCTATTPRNCAARKPAKAKPSIIVSNVTSHSTDIYLHEAAITRFWRHAFLRAVAFR